MIDYSISSPKDFYICRDCRFVRIPENIKKNLITNCVINRLMSIFIFISIKKFHQVNINSFSAKFQTTFVVFFFFNKLPLEKKLIRKVERLNVKQRRSRSDGSYEPSHLDLCCLQKPIIIVCGSESYGITLLFDFTCYIENLLNFTVLQLGF